MSILDLGTGPSRPSVGKKSTRIFLGFGLLVAVIGIGSTFASTISINANQDIEFGQGAVPYTHPTMTQNRKVVYHE